MMAAAAQAPPGLSPAHGAAEAEDSNISSPLSEVEDKDGEPDEMEGIILHSQDATHDEALESDSNLSDANDTEAETERLYDTPQVRRHKDMVVDQFNEGKVIERTPSKLENQVLADSIEENGDDDDESLSSSSDDMSAAPSTHLEDAESSIKTAKSTEPSSVDESKQPPDARKRKRSAAADQSDSEGPLRKRPASVGVPDTDIHDEENAAGDDETTSAHAASLGQSPTDEGTGSLGNKDEKEDTAVDDDTIVPNPEAPVKLTRSGSKLKAAEADMDNDDHEGGTEDDADPTADEEIADGEVEAEEGDIAEKNDAEEGRALSFTRNDR